LEVVIGEANRVALQGITTSPVPLSPARSAASENRAGHWLSVHARL
jgi:hypothetical protein